MRIIKISILGWVLILILSACSSTKYLKDNQYLLRDNKIQLDNKNIDKAELKGYAKQLPNRRILGWPMYVSLYNMVNPVKEAERDVKRQAKLKEKNKKRLEKGKPPKEDPFYFSRWWKNSVGEAPVIYDSHSIKESEISMKGYLRNVGYYYSQIEDSVIFDERNRTVIVKYYIEEGAPYRYLSFKRSISDPRIESLLENASLKWPQKETAFNAYKLDDLRYKLSDVLRDDGYFGFGPDQVTFFADTLKKSKQVKVDMKIFPNEIQKDTIAETATFPVSVFKNVNVVNYPYQLDLMKDKNLKTIYFGADSLSFDYYGRMEYKPFLVHRRLDVLKDSLYRQSDVARSIRAINALGIFKSVQFKITPNDQQKLNDSIQDLDVELQLSPAVKQSYSIDLEGYTSSGTIGTGLIFTYQHRNLFKRAIYLNLSVNGKLESIRSNLENSANLLAYEYGISSSLRFPRFFSPFNLYKFNNRFFPSTIFNFNYTFKNRTEYVRQTSSLGYGYSWTTPKKIRHNLNPIDFYLTEFKEIDFEYLQYLIDKNLYDQYFDHVIPAGNYSIAYSNQNIKQLKNFFYLNFRIEVAGNLFTLANKLVNAPQKGSGDLYIQVIEAIAYDNIPDSLQQDFVEHYQDSLNQFGPNYYTFNGLLYNQYFKSDIDYRYNWFFNKNLNLVCRFFGGLIIPYGNTDFSPIEKQYFVGGSNDLRAWYARSVGPGAYVLDEQTLQLKNYYQHGDIKLLTNIELRHTILWRFKGALFADIGNVWNLKENKSFPNGKFQLDRFYNQLAVGVGYGIRLDLSFFILRFDLAFKIHDPSIKGNTKWVYSQGDSYYKTPVLNFGIGYPF